MADTTRQANTARQRTIDAVFARYPGVYYPGLENIIDAIPTDLLAELHDERRMNGEQS